MDRAKSEAGRNNPPKGTVSVRPIHMGEGKPGMVVLRIGDDVLGTNTALEPDEAYRLSHALHRSAYAAECAKELRPSDAEWLIAKVGEVTI